MSQTGHESLDGLTTAVFGSSTSSSSSVRPAGRHEHDLVVLQWQGRPRMLVPRCGRRAAAGIVNARPRLARRKEARLRQALGATLLTGVPQAVLARRGPLVAGGAVGGPAELVEALREAWDTRVSALGFSVRAVTVNYKPTFVAVDRRGRVLGFGKVSGDTGARDRLEAEGAALQEMAADPVPDLRTPAVLATLDWAGALVLVVEPIPRASRRYPNAGAAPAHLLEHARRFAARLDPVERAEALAAAVCARGVDEHGHAASALVEQMRRRLAGVSASAGRSHGDLVPWNIATLGPQTWAWDWEHSLARDAVATDVVHWYVQVERHVRGRSLLAAHAAAEPPAQAQLAAIGLGPGEIAAVRWLARLLVVERWGRLGRSFAEVGGVDPEAGLRAEMTDLLVWR